MSDHATVVRLVVLDGRSAGLIDSPSYRVFLTSGTQHYVQSGLTPSPWGSHMLQYYYTLIVHLCHSSQTTEIQPRVKLKIFPSLYHIHMPWQYEYVLTPLWYALYARWLQSSTRSSLKQRVNTGPSFWYARRSSYGTDHSVNAC